MAVGFDSSSEQNSIFKNLSSRQSAGTTITVSLGDEELFTYTSTKGFQSIVLSLPEFNQSGTYTLTCGTYTEDFTF
jgi:hypothetical protein